VYQDYMLREWLPVLVDMTLTDADISRRLTAAGPDVDGTITQTRYGVNEIIYDISLTKPRLLVENEMFFPGWRARLSEPAGSTIEAIAVNGVFRGWVLPAGRYTMTARFQFPQIGALWVVCVMSF